MRKLIKTYLPIALALLVACGVIIEIDISDEEIVMTSPGDGVEIPGPEVTFSWEELEGATDYRVVVVAPSFDDLQKVELDTTLTGLLSFSDDFIQGSYAWSVRGLNSEYETVPSIRNFDVTEPIEIDLTEEEIAVISPNDEGSTTDTRILFKWDEVLGAQFYQLRVYKNQTDDGDDNDEPQFVELDLREAEHYASASQVLSAGDYYWEISAHNSESSTRNFRFTFTIEEEATTGG